MKGAPWFKFWVADFRGGTSEMTPHEVGVYTRLLCIQWEQLSLPNDPARLAVMAGGSVPEIVVGKFDAGEDGRLRNARLEEERKGATTRSVKAEAAANARWAEERDAESMPKQCLGHALSIAHGIAPSNASGNAEDRGQSIEDREEKIQDKELKKEESCADPGIQASAPEASPVAVWFDCTGKPDKWPLAESQVAEWALLYPGVDVLAECKRACAWEKAQPNRRKTARGKTAFLLRWISKAQNQSRGAGQSTQPGGMNSARVFNQARHDEVNNRNAIAIGLDPYALD